MKVVLQDNITLDWAKGTINNMKGESGEQLYRAMGPGDIPPLTKYWVYLPKEITTSQKDLLTLLASCNKGVQEKNIQVKAAVPKREGP